MRVCPQCDLRTEADRCPKDGSVTVDEAVLAVAGGKKKKKDANIGRVIAEKYRLVERLGAGGFATVYRAVHKQMGGDVAIKIMASHLMEDESAVKRFYLEAQNTHKLRHPNTVRVTDFGGTEDGTLYLVMEYLPGVTLRAVVEREGRLSARRVVHIVEQVLKSLGEAHSKGLVHRDIKPDNVMLLEQFGEPDFVKVLDFGISRALDSARLTSANGAVGTPKNMAPEQWKGEELDGRTDLYAVGVMMYGLLTGEHPFNMKTGVHGTTEMIAYMNAHLMERPQPLLERTPGACPQALADFVHRLLAKDMAQRPADAQAALKELGKIRAEHALPDEVPEAAKWANTATSMMPSPFAEGGAAALADQATKMLDTAAAGPGAAASLLPGLPSGPGTEAEGAPSARHEDGDEDEGATRMMSAVEMSDVVPRAPAAREAPVARPRGGAGGVSTGLSDLSAGASAGHDAGRGRRPWVWAAVGLAAVAAVAVYLAASGLGAGPEEAGAAASSATAVAAHAGGAPAAQPTARPATGPAAERAAADAGRSAAGDSAGASAGGGPAAGAAAAPLDADAGAPGDAELDGGADVAPDSAMNAGPDAEAATDGGADAGGTAGAGWTLVLTSTPEGATVRVEGLGVVGTTPLAWAVPAPLQAKVSGGAPLALSVSPPARTGQPPAQPVSVALGAKDFASGRLERAVKLEAPEAPDAASEAGQKKAGASRSRRGAKRAGGKKGGKKSGKRGGKKGGKKGGGWGF